MITPKYEEFTIENLVRLFKEEQDEKAFDEILKRYYHLILGACNNFSNDPEDSKDLTLEVCTLVWEKLKTQEVQNFDSWVYSICKNHCMDYHRSKNSGIARVVEYTPEKLVHIAAEQNDLDYEVEQEESFQQLNNLMEELPAEQRVCLRLFYLKKLSYNRISSKTGYSLKQIKSALQTGRINLRKAVNQ